MGEFFAKKLIDFLNDSASDAEEFLKNEHAKARTVFVEFESVKRRKYNTFASFTNRSFRSYIIYDHMNDYVISCCVTVIDTNNKTWLFSFGI